MVVARFGSPEHRHHRVPHVLHHRSAGPKDGAIHLRSVTVELLGEHRRVGVLGDRRVAADVAHQHGDVEAFRLADAAAPGEQLGGDAGRQQTAQRLALLLALDDRLMQPAQTIEGAGLAGGNSLGELPEQTARRAPRPRPPSTVRPRRSA